MTKIKGRCIVCGEELSEPLFSLAEAPAGAYEMPDREGLPQDYGITLPLCVCPGCGLSQLDIEPVSYYRDVRRAVGLSATMRDLRRADCELLIDRYGCSGKWVEIGCGAGDFLRVLSEYPVDIYGTEHDPESVTAAREALCKAGADKDKNKHIMQWFPEDGDALIPGAPYDVFLSFNFLEHQPDPAAMLRAAYNSLKPEGIGLITVPSFEYIAENGRFYELIRDHIANFDLGSLRYLVESCGFSVLEEGFLGIGDTLRMIVRKGGAARRDSMALTGAAVRQVSQSHELYAQHKSPERPCRRAAHRDSMALAESLTQGYYEYTAKIEKFVLDAAGSGESIALWGAGHQGFTLAATTLLRGAARYIIDSSPLKQGRFAPSSHIPIVAPEYFTEDPVDLILIVAPGYVSEIEARIRERSRRVGIADIIDLRVR